MTASRSPEGVLGVIRAVVLGHAPSELGQGKDGIYPEMAAPVLIADLEVSDIALSDDHLCVIDAGETPGQVICSGPEHSVLGNGVNTWQGLGQGLPVIHQDGTPIVASEIDISDDRRACARLTDGGAACWGYDYTSANACHLGSMDYETQGRAVRVEAPGGDAPLSGVTEIGSGRHMTRALAEGEVICWGALGTTPPLKRLPAADPHDPEGETFPSRSRSH